jgi:hypothetical protein
MIVAINNTPERFFDYTHTTEPAAIVGGGSGTIGGGGDRYADFVVDVVRPAIAAAFGEAPVRGIMGSSLGGLISLHISRRHPTDFHFAACLSSSFGWGSIGNTTANDGDRTLIDAVRGDGVGPTILAIDAGGDDRVGCEDRDGDGINDDADAGDNLCETKQMRDVLVGEGYVLDDTLFFFRDAGVSGVGAEHREDAWAFRAATIHVPRFMTMQP